MPGGKRKFIIAGIPISGSLSLNTKVRFVPTGVAESDKAPDLRAYARSNGIEFGAAWTKRAKDGARVYHSVKLDDPSFPNPIYASLVDTADANLSDPLIPRDCHQALNCI